jgi:hypothetical protein
MRCAQHRSLHAGQFSTQGTCTCIPFLIHIIPPLRLLCTFFLNLCSKKKKWSKGKMKEKVNNLVLFDQATYDKLIGEVPKYKMITPSILADRLRLNGSLARAAIRELLSKVRCSAGQS